MYFSQKKNQTGFYIFHFSPNKNISFLNTYKLNIIEMVSNLQIIMCDTHKASICPDNQKRKTWSQYQNQNNKQKPKTTKNKKTKPLSHVVKPKGIIP